MFRIQLWVECKWLECGSSNTEEVARWLLRDTAKYTPGAYRLLNPAGQVIDSVNHEMPLTSIRKRA